MKRAVFLLMIALLCMAGVALAADGYDLSWHAITGGGGLSAGGGLALGGGLVQPAGAMQGGNYQLTSGFWSFGAAAAARFPQLFLPVLLKRMTRP